jgi:mono/diheme cytochrome c family protein
VFLLVLGLSGKGLSQSAPRAARAASAAPSRPAGSAAAAEKQRTAASRFSRSCARCHADDGRGGAFSGSDAAIPDFSRSSWHRQRSDAELLVSILDGKGRRMPAFAGKVSEEQARDLVAFIRTFDPAPLRRQTAPADDFERRFHELQDQWDELQRQVEELVRLAHPTEPAQATRTSRSH